MNEKSKHDDKGAATAPASPAQPRYDEGLRYDSGVRYAATDVPLPANDGGRVKLDLAQRDNANAVAFAQNHIEMMTDNSNFTTPIPPAPEFLAKVDALQAKMALVESLTSQLKEARTGMDTARTDFDASFVSRAGYVQSASNGNSEVILSSGLELRNPRTPTGQLPPPQGLKADLNGVTGLVLLSWKPEPRARGYVGRVSENVTPRNWNPLPGTTKSRLQLPGMEVGKTYVFQMASVGGTTGQSYWSPEVIRAAA